MNTNIQNLNEMLTKEGHTILNDFKSFCRRNYSNLQLMDVEDTFNDCYIACYKSLSNSDNPTDVKKYFYKVLKNAAFKLNKKASASKLVSLSQLEGLTQPVEPNLGSDSIDIEADRAKAYIELVEEIIQWVSENYSKSELDMFKFRVLSRMNYREMAIVSGYSVFTMSRILKPIMKAAQKQFKTKLININERFKTDS